MRIAVVGGNLQGVEACYLARKAGWEVVLVDRRSGAPASALCDRHVRIDVTSSGDFDRLLENVDLIIPALEDLEALSCLTEYARAVGVPFAYDADAYAVSRSKANSNRLFARMGIPVPAPWPDCGFPIVAKPGHSSGSRGVRILRSERDFERAEAEVGSFDGWILQQFVQGNLFSLEVIGTPGNHRAVQITDLFVDELYDCKRVVAPTIIPAAPGEQFMEMAIDIAGALKLKGIIDVEAVVRDGGINVLEVDARVPSQTPTAVYWSTGLNLVEELAGVFLPETEKSQAPSPSPRAVIYEHIRVSPGMLEVAGEHIMSGVDPLHVAEKFFGANEAITNYSPDRDEWVATLICCGTDREVAWERRAAVIRDIRRRFELKVYKES